MTIKFFEDSNALDSLRHSDFDALSAYGEVIDNSLQADAKKIAIQMDCSSPRANYHQIKELVFGDDGIGMPKETLHSCLKLGWSSRYNDRSGIGRFGVGMVLGAIHEVRRVEVYSKEKGDVWHKTYIDLDEIEAGEMESIPEPIKQNVPKRYKNLVGVEHGALVIWSKYDKQRKSGHTLLKEASHWIGRTFRYFIWDDIEIYLNGERVKVHDPLYVRTDKTRFPEDPAGTEYKTIPLKWKVSGSDPFEDAGDVSEIEIKLSLLPEEFRKTAGSGGSAISTERNIQENEGVSILRNRREVFYGTLPYWSTVRWDNKGGRTWSFEEKDRWWGCEILFSAELDSDFSVRNIKRGADPLPELKAAIKQMITPTRKSALDEVDRVWNDARAAKEEAQKEEDEKLGRGSHKSAEEIAKKTATPNSKYNASVSAEEAASEILENALIDQDEDKRAALEALFSSQPFTISDSSWRGSTFWEVFHAGGNSLLSYNKNHDFFSEIYRLMDGLEDDNLEPVDVAKSVRTLIDLLLISAAKAQALHDEESEVQRVGDFIEEYNQQWGMLLSSYVRNWIREQDA
jgi:hypothetical protein